MQFNDKYLGEKVTEISSKHLKASKLLLLFFIIYQYKGIVGLSYKHYQLVHWLAIGGQHTCANFGCRWSCFLLVNKL